MNCRNCGHANSDEASSCQECGQPLVDDSDATVLRPGVSRDESVKEESPTQLRPRAVGGGRSSASGPGGPASRDSSALPTYHSFGNRFEILELLGEGGMGRVYKAWDRELEKVVALKTIRGDRASNPELLKRFKQELLLARKITHKHVIRIHDLGEAEGVRFFTMDYVQGENLKERVQKRSKIPAKESVPIIKQTLGALAEAHSQGVVHRDLKPHNIMIDTEGLPLIMDFGIARSVGDTGGMTETGAVVGTPDYMSPEQARGEKADEQADVFSFGVIMYEMLTGDLPYKGDTTVSRVMARLNQKPRALREMDPEIPKYLENVVLKCLEVDKALRYKSAQEVLEDIERETVDRSPLLRLRRAAARRKPLLAVAVAALIALAAALHFALRPRAPAGGPPLPSATLAIVPFANASGDPGLDWLGSSLAAILTTEVGQSEGLRTVSGDRVSQILSDLRLKAGSRIDSATLARVAEFSKADTVVSGQYLKLGEQIRIDATVLDLKRDRTVALKAEAPNEAALLATIRSLAAEVRANLGLSRDVVKELQAGSFRPSSESLQALRYYGEGVQLSAQGKHVEASKRFEAAVREDPEFALAYAARGQSYASLGYDSEAEESLSTAIELSAELPQQEKYFITAIQARLRKDYDKAIQSYENLEKAAPKNAEVKYRLAELYEAKGGYDRAQGLYQEVLARDPNSLAALLALGSIEYKRGRPQQAFEPLNQALSLATQLGNEEARGSSLYWLGAAYAALGKNDEAVRHFQDSLARRTEVGDKRGTAEALRELAKLDWTAGRAEEALTSNNKALKLYQEIGDRVGAARVLLGLGDIYHRRGQHDKALEMFKSSLQTLRELGDKRLEAICLNYIGNVHWEDGDHADAQTNLELALRVREELGDKILISETVHNLGEFAFLTGRYDRAIDHYLRALELAREGGDELAVAIESYSLGAVFGLQGRLGASVKAAEEALRSLEKAGESGYWRAEILGGHGSALSRMGRFEDASKSLDEALKAARELKIPRLVALTLSYMAEAAFYQGSFERPRTALDEALRVASGQKDERVTLPVQVNLAKLETRDSANQASIDNLKALAGRADALGLRYYSAECAISGAEVLLRAGRHQEAGEMLENALREAARSGLRVHVAKLRHLLGERFRLEGSETESRRHYREAARVLEEIRQEAGTEDVLKRADLGPIYQESVRRSSRALGP